MQACQSNQRDILTQIILTIFRVNANLLEKGDKLVAPLGITSAIWKILGGIALFEQPPSCSQIVAAMGITRQGAQKQLNLALKKGLIESFPNPRHERSPLYALTQSGRDICEKAMKIQVAWANDLAQNITLMNLQTTLDALNDLEIRLQSTPLPASG